MSTAESPHHLLVPGRPAADRAALWVAVADEPVAGLQLAVGGSSRPLPDAWDVLTAAGRTLRSQVVTVEGLPPGERLPASLSAGGQVVATAMATTLPVALPNPMEPPFTVLAGSCFCAAQDPSGAAGAAAARLPVAARPAVSVLSGDQVYLDSPAMHFLANTHSPDELAGELLDRYLATWSQHAPLGGFRRLLTSGANVFSSDDHDYWNNAPNAAPYVRDTWTGGGRDAWLAAANRLYDRFQAPEPGTTFRVGRLSFFVGDVRRARSADRSTVMTATQLAALSAWLRDLDGPGVLVLGQPVFVRSTGWKGHLTDWALADFRQYGDLVRLLVSTPHDLLVVTGDVHFGRVASCTLPSGRRIVEVIASPFALVHPVARGQWSQAPAQFPAVPVPGVAAAPITTEAYQVIDNHFLTLGFAGVGAAVRVSATSWPIGGAAQPGRPVHQTELH